MKRIKEFLMRKIPFLSVLSLLLFLILSSIYGTTLSLFTFDAKRQFPALRAIQNAPFGMLLVFLVCFLLSVLVYRKIAEDAERDERGFEVSESGIMGNSYFMGEEEKRDFFTLTKMNAVDNADPKGLILGVEEKTGEVLARPWKEKDYLHRFPNNNVVLVGGAGSGKTSSFLIPALFEFMRMGYSVICTDPKGELYRESYALAKAAGYKINVINLLEGQFEYSDGMDLLKLVRESADPQTAADVMAKQLIVNFQGENQGKDSFWLLANLNCLKLALLYVSHARGFTSSVRPNTAGTQRTLEAVYDALSDGEFEDRIRKDLAANPEDLDFLKKPFETWSGHSQKDSIRAGLATALGLLQNRMLARILSEDDINCQSFNDRPTILYIISSDQNTTFRGVLTTITTFLFDEIAKIADSHTPATLDRPLYFLFEELFSIGKIPDIVEKVSTLRSRGVGMLFCLQDIVQLKVRYEELYETILSNCSIKLFLGGDGTTTTQFFSDLTGTMTAINQEASRSRVENDLLGLRQDSASRVSSSSVSRSVMLSDEVSKIGIDELLIFPVGRDMLKEKKFYYKNHYYYGFKLVDEAGNIVTHTPTMHMPRWNLERKKMEYRMTTGMELSYQPPHYEVKYFPDYFRSVEEKESRASSNRFRSLFFEEQEEAPPAPARKTKKTFSDFLGRDGEEELQRRPAEALHEEDLLENARRKEPVKKSSLLSREPAKENHPEEEEEIFGEDFRL